MNKTREIVLISLLAVLVFAQEEILLFLPNIKFSAFLLFLYAKKLSFKDNVFIIIIYVILDYLYIGYFDLTYIITAIIGWLMMPVLFKTVFKKVENTTLMALCSIVPVCLYFWAFSIPTCLFYRINPLVYIAGDIIYELPLIVTTFLCIIFLYNPMSKLLDSLLVKYDIEGEK